MFYGSEFVFKQSIVSLTWVADQQTINFYVLKDVQWLKMC